VSTFTSPLLEKLRALRETPPAAVPELARSERPAPPARLPHAPARPLPLSSLPAHLAPLVQAAARGELPTGPVFLSSGLVIDLNGYVLAWAECWPRDGAHVLRRLEEAHAVRP
jgi:hypothetical protein